MLNNDFKGWSRCTFGTEAQGVPEHMLRSEFCFLCQNWACNPSISKSTPGFFLKLSLFHRQPYLGAWEGKSLLLLLKALVDLLQIIQRFSSKSQSSLFPPQSTPIIKDRYAKVPLIYEY